MGAFKEIFKPTKGKVTLTIVLFFIYFVATSLYMICPAIARICPVDADTPGAIIDQISGEYYVGAKSIPFSCKQTCTDAEYTSALVNIFIFNFIVPIIVIYVILSLLVFVLNRLRK